MKIAMMIAHLLMFWVLMHSDYQLHPLLCQQSPFHSLSKYLRPHETRLRVQSMLHAARLHRLQRKHTKAAQLPRACDSAAL
jgi:hypothetical protein